MSAWFEPNTEKELVGLKTFSQLQRSLGAYGISGVDRLLCFMIVKDLRNFTNETRTLVEKSMKSFLLAFEEELHPTSIIPTNTKQVYPFSTLELFVFILFAFGFVCYFNLFRLIIVRYSNGLAKTKALVPVFLDTATRIGQMQLLRRQIANLLNVSFHYFLIFF